MGALDDARAALTARRWAASACIVALLVLALPAGGFAHIGSPNVFFEGMAGAYPVRIVVRPPAVVPGLAEVTVHVAGAQRVLMRPVFWRVGSAGAPSADEAKPVRGTSDTYAGRLWLMARGAYSVYVTVDGARGSGTAVVPVLSVATQRLGMSTGLGILLAGLGALLLAGLVTIVYDAAGASLVPPGGEMDAALRRRARRIAVLALPILAAMLLGARLWWSNVDEEYARRMDRPPAMRSSLSREHGLPTLHLTFTDSGGNPLVLDPLMPDHGKMMHLFLIKIGGAQAFGHVHPVYTESTSMFVAVLPPLPPGSYRLFGDITYERGESRTLVGAIGVAASDSAAASGATGDDDDAWSARQSTARRVGSDLVDSLAEGGSVTWIAGGDPLVAGRETTLRFRVRGPGGVPANLEPYMGMAAHAVVAAADGSVFVHLHPAGTVSIAAQQVFALRDRGDTTPAGRLRLGDTSLAAAAPHAMDANGEITFPYEFPRAGDYRIWVQVRRAGRVRTSSFEARVGAGEGG